MKRETFTFAGTGGKELPAVVWIPEGELRGVLQVTHGMTEHMGRYEALAHHLTAQGIAVAGFDLRGHGKNPGDPHVASFGEGGWQASLGDMHAFFTLLAQRFAEVSHFMLGFSLGSFLLREYVNAYPEDVGDGVIILGTGHQPGWLLSVMMTVVKSQMKKAGFDGTTDLVRQLSFGAYNQKFKPNQTSADWLCAEAGQRDDYLADPLVRRDISAGLFYDLLAAMKRTGSPFAYDGWDTDLPVLLLSGAEDPVGDAGKGVAQIYAQMKKTGMEHVTMKLYPGARHDLLHEEGGSAQAARQHIAQWLRSHG